MKSTWFGSRDRYEFAKALAAADYAKHTWDLFRTWATCARISLLQGVHRLFGSFDEKIEDQYMQEIGRVKHAKHFADAMGVLVMSLEKEPQDFLGMVYQELGIANQSLAGQFFTPFDLCRVTAQMIIGDVKPERGKRFSIAEPACGAGAMAIAAAEHLKSLGFYPWHYRIHAQDIDEKCFSMTYVQLTLLGVPAVVMNGNTITLETRESIPTFALAMHPDRQHAVDDAAECIAELPSGKKQNEFWR